MANLAKEATTARRVLESLFRYLDSENLWTLQTGLAFPVLKDMQLLMESSGSMHFQQSICLTFFCFSFLSIKLYIYIFFFITKFFDL